MKIKQVEDVAADTIEYSDEAETAIAPDTTLIEIKDTEGTVLDSFEVAEKEEADGTLILEFQLPDGTPVILKEIDGAGRQKLQEAVARRGEKNPMAPAEVLHRLIGLMCVQWGDQPRVTPDYFQKLKYRKLRPIERRLEAVISQYFPA